MNLKEKIQKGQEISNFLNTKCWEDESFKQELISHPNKTIDKYLGDKIKFPKDKKIVVEDQTNDSYIYINIPVNRSIDDLQLSEEELDNVSGGVLLFIAGLAVAWWIHEYDREYDNNRC